MRVQLPVGGIVIDSSLTHSISAWERVLTRRLQRQKKQVDVGIGLPLEHPVLSTGESERMPSVTNGKE